MTGDIRVNLLDGVYNLTSPLTLTESSTIHDSGTNGYNVIYQAATGARPMISGGTTVSGWTLYDSQKNIYRAPLATPTRQFYVNGMRATRARGQVPPGDWNTDGSGWVLPSPSLGNFVDPLAVELVSRLKWKLHRCHPSSVTIGAWRNRVSTSTATSFNAADGWGSAIPGAIQTYQLGDFNGDGKTDLLYSNGTSSSWHNEVRLSLGTAFSSTTSDWLSYGYGKPVYVGDFNGDGKSDLLFAFSDAGGWHNYVALSNGAGFTFQYGDWMPGNGAGVPYRLGDFNGDGKTDILFAYSDGTAWRNYVALSTGTSFNFTYDWMTNAGQGVDYKLGDFNGDGKTDLLLAYQDGSVWRNYVAISTGSGFAFAYGDWGSNVGKSMTYRLGDFNGDGKTDLLFAYKQGGSWKNLVYRSTGTSFVSAGNWLSEWGEGNTYYVGDFSGDNRDELLFTGRETTAIMESPCWHNADGDTLWDTYGVAWIENAYELLDDEGEWYRSPAGYIYYKPRSGENLSTAITIAPSIDSLVVGEGANAGTSSAIFLHNIKFSGITFSYAGWNLPSSTSGYAEFQAGYHLEGVVLTNPWDAAVRTPAAVSFSAASNIIFERNLFTHLGAAGLSFEKASQQLSIFGNKFTDISSVAIEVGEDRFQTPAAGQTVSQLPASQRTRYNEIHNNFISRVALEYEGAVGIFLGYHDHANVHHNEIEYLSYSGISSGWGWTGYAGGTWSYAQWNSIHHNRIHDVMQTLLDGGGIYTLSFQSQSTLTANYIYNVGIGGNAIYHDEGSSLFVDRDNVIGSSPRWLSMWKTTVDYNDIQNNYALSDVAVCAYPVDGSVGSSLNCNFGGNVVLGNTFGPLGSAALSIANASGLESSYLDIKSGFCGDTVCNAPETSSSCARDCAP